MEQPLITVIMPAYNAEKYIEQAVKSVEEQKYENWELIICDDSSTDSTKKYLETIDSPKIKVIFHKKNKGVTEARNSAIKRSRGEYLAFLDSDDYWLPNKLINQISFMKKKNISFSCTSYGIIKNQKISKKIFHSVEKLNYKSYMKNTSIGNSSVIIKKQSFPYFRVENGPIEDVVTWMKLLKEGAICYGLDEPLTMYRVTKDSASGNKLENAKKYFNMLVEKQNLNLFQASYYEICYLSNAIIKRVF